MEVRVLRKAWMRISFALTILCLIAPATLAISITEPSFISQDLLSIANTHGNRLAVANTDLFGLGIPYNQISLKMNLGKIGMLFEINDLQNEIDLVYKERTGSLTTSFEISNKITLGSKIKLSQINTVITGGGWGLDLGLIYRPMPKLELSLGLDNVLTQKKFSTNTQEQGEVCINSSMRFSVGSGLSVLCNLATEDYNLGLEQLLSNKVALSVSAANSRIIGGFSLLQRRTGLDYKLAVHPLGVQQTIMFSVAF